MVKLLFVDVFVSSLSVPASHIEEKKRDLRALIIGLLASHPKILSLYTEPNVVSFTGRGGER
jgi:hypothetical protein